LALSGEADVWMKLASPVDFGECYSKVHYKYRKANCETTACTHPVATVIERCHGRIRERICRIIFYKYR
jgi:hypothetical protein